MSSDPLLDQALLLYCVAHGRRWDAEREWRDYRQLYEVQKAVKLMRAQLATLEPCSLPVSDPVEESRVGPLYKSQITIWSDFDSSAVELSHLAREAESGDALCTSFSSERVRIPENDPDWTDTDFFGPSDGDEDT